jgi:hypothetical protein
MKLILAIIGALLALFSGPLSASATTLTVAPGSDGSVIMMAASKDVNGVERIDLDFSYPTAFSEPRVNIQGGDFSEEQMLRDSKPGFLKLAITREGEEMLADSLVITLNFDVKPANQSVPVTSVAAKYYYTSGETDSPVVKIKTPKEAKKPAAAPDAPKTTPAQESRSAKPAAPRAGEGGAILINRAIPAAPGRDGQSGENLDNLEYRECPDPLQRFRDYQGDRNLAGLLPLFALDNPCGCRQTPPVAISDGIGKVSVSFETDADPLKAPNYRVTGGRFLSLKRDYEKSWTIEIVPNRGEHDVVFYFISGRVLKRIPLVVAPPLALYLQSLSPDDKLSPLLEFTIAANYLADHRETSANTGH